MAKYLLEQESNIHADDDLALQRACQGDHFDVIKYLVEQEVNIHADDDLALDLVCQNDNEHLNIVKYFLEKKSTFIRAMIMLYDWLV